MNTTSTKVIQSMFNHLAASYTEDEARDILVQKYPESEGEIKLLQPASYTVTKVEMGKVVSVQEAQTDSDLTKAVKAKVAKAPKAPKEKAPRAETKADVARQLFADAEDKSRGAMIKVFMEKLGMSKAAASTYFYNVKG